MNPYSSLIVTILYLNELLRCGLKVDTRKLPKDCIQYWAEPENRSILWEMLPEHVRSCGNIVEVEEIFEITDNT